MTLKLTALSLVFSLTCITVIRASSISSNDTGNGLSTNRINLMCNFQTLSAECEIFGVHEDGNDLKISSVIPKTDDLKNLTKFGSKYLTISKNFKIEAIPDEVGIYFPFLDNFRVTKTGVKVIQRRNFGGMNALRYLSLDSNKISVIYGDSFNDLSALESLYISNNRIEFLHPNLLEGLPKLRSFMADYNKISIISASLFRLNENLEWISLASNTLKDIMVDFRTFEKLVHLNFEKNHENCNIKFDEHVADPDIRLQKITDFQLQIEKFCKI